jgi:adenylosuccinate synthase
MKLDVLDGLDTIRLCTAYRRGDRLLKELPAGADAVAECVPVYEDMPGWQSSTVGVREWSQLPANARRYLERLSEVAGVPIDMVSTGPDRVDTILLRDPFSS